MNRDNTYIDLARQIIMKAVDKSQYAVFLFGSRTEERHSQTADIDIGILGHQPLSIASRAHLLELLNESDIPFKVDVVDFYNADPEFKRHALKKIVIWNQPNSISLD